MNTPKKVSFNLLPPNQYLIRVTLDENNNGTWDTGNFLDKKQPEVVKYFENVITIRANWEENEVFNID
ncbi:hypothetical protein MNBD_BACTEROID04-1328 [hydrothermal vent metagenome]|uniref:Uncharacterized protein n=1 Tax=hydrothermal vent metagenome TaxID=652676 RepID=A0A3B0U3H0_9ZZZZ